MDFLSFLASDQIYLNVFAFVLIFHRHFFYYYSNNAFMHVSHEHCFNLIFSTYSLYLLVVFNVKIASLLKRIVITQK